MTQRVIKFRAWDKYRKAMVTDFVMAPTSPDWAPFPIENSEEANKLLNDLDRKNGDPFGGDYTLTDWGNYYGIENLIVMQFTGLLDKHGKEIYEGDIIKCDIIERENHDDYSSGKPIKVYWDEECAGFYPFIKASQWRSEVYDIEKLGDIYTSPELVDPKMIEHGNS